MAKTKFKIGDRVKIGNIWDPAYGKIGTIVKKYNSESWTIKIPGFEGHDGDIFDGTLDKRFINEEFLTKLPEEKESMKIEVKQSEKPKKIAYPCFRLANVGSVLIVLFFEEGSGIVVDRGSSGWSVGEYYDCFTSKFETLQNYSATISSEP